MPIQCAPIEAGGSMSFPPCRLAGLGPNSELTESRTGRVFAAGPEGASYGDGTAPLVAGAMVAGANDAVGYFAF